MGLNCSLSSNRILVFLFCIIFSRKFVLLLFHKISISFKHLANLATSTLLETFLLLLVTTNATLLCKLDVIFNVELLFGGLSANWTLLFITTSTRYKYSYNSVNDGFALRASGGTILER
jgi:uncharacterized membrane protein YagU involved in acid resistance